MWRLPQEKNELKVHTALSSACASFPANRGDGRCPGKWLGGLLPLEAKCISSMKAKTGDKSPFATLPQAAPWYQKPHLREGHLLFLTVLKISLNCTRVLWTNHEWRVLLTFGESWKHRHAVRPGVSLGLGDFSMIIHAAPGRGCTSVTAWVLTLHWSLAENTSVIPSQMNE